MFTSLKMHVKDFLKKYICKAFKIFATRKIIQKTFIFQNCIIRKDSQCEHLLFEKC